MHPWYVRTYLLQGEGADMSSTNADRRWAIDAPTAPQPRKAVPRRIVVVVVVDFTGFLARFCKGSRDAALDMSM
jgi:hypothetical protein